MPYNAVVSAKVLPSTINGASVRTRTGDLRITSALLYQLSYAGLSLERTTDSNPRPLAWEANALPTELCPRFNAGYNITSFELAPLFFSNLAANFRVFFRYARGPRKRSMRSGCLARRLWSCLRSGGDEELRRFFEAVFASSRRAASASFEHVETAERRQAGNGEAA